MLRQIPGKKKIISTQFNKWALVTTQGYHLVASYDLLGGRLDYSGPNEKQVNATRANLGKNANLNILSACVA